MLLRDIDLQINKKRSEFPRDFNSTPRMLERYEKRWTIPRAKGGTAKTFLKIYSAGPKCRQVFFCKKVLKYANFMLEYPLYLHFGHGDPGLQ